MVLDALSEKSRQDIKNIVVSPENKHSITQRRLEELKKSTAYSRKDNRWYDDLNAIQAFYNTQSSFYELLVISFYDPNRVKKKISALKDAYFDRSGQFLDPSYLIQKDKTRFQGNKGYTEDILLVNLIEARFDKVKAKKIFEQAKESSLFDSQSQEWFYGSIDHTRIVRNQLLSVIVEAQFDKNAAFEHYQKLLNDPRYYSNRDHIWIDPGKEIQSRTDTVEQLLGVIAQAQFDSKSAKKRYELLKESPLFDKNSGHWNKYVYTQITNGVSESKPTYCEFLDIWIGNLLYGEGEGPSTKTDLPVKRSF